MGFRFRKSVKVAPGVRLNFGKKSTGISFGGKGAGVSINSKSGVMGHVSVPGTGLSYTSKPSSHQKSQNGNEAEPAQKSQKSREGMRTVAGNVFLAIGFIAYIALAILMIIMEWFLFAGFCIVIAVFAGVVLYRRFLEE